MSTPNPTKLPPAPAGLSAEAKALWQSVVADYVLEKWQLKLLQTACEALDLMRQSQEAIKKHGVVIEQRDGSLKSNPAVIHARDARNQVAQIIRSLGLDIIPIVKGKPGRPGSRVS